jgi:hypothetical protein
MKMASFMNVNQKASVEQQQQSIEQQQQQWEQGQDQRISEWMTRILCFGCLNTFFPQTTVHVLRVSHIFPQSYSANSNWSTIV